jgi:ABC-2 type transport system permease protein
MNIFMRELKANFRSLVTWSVIVVLFVITGAAKFSAYYKNPEMLAVLNNLPSAYLDAFNMRAFNLTTASGFFGLMFTYNALMLGIAAGMWGSDIITKEERDRTVEFALTLPVTRSHVVTAKTLAALANCVVLLLVTWGASLVSVQQFQPDSAFFSFMRLCMLALFIIEMIFLAIGVLLGCAMKQYKRASSAAVGILLVTYFISIISAMNANLDFLKYFSPFKYFDPVVLLHEARFDLGFVLLSVAIIAASMIGAYVTYSRRDLYI